MPRISPDPPPDQTGRAVKPASRLEPAPHRQGDGRIRVDHAGEGASMMLTAATPTPAMAASAMAADDRIRDASSG
jgi:hypothetical protein